MTVHIERFGPDRIQINAGPRMGDLVKQIPGARYRNAEQDWTAPLSWGTCLAARGVFGAELEVGAALAEWAWAYKELVDRVEQIKAGALSYVADDRLYPTQLIGASLMVAAGRFFLADDFRVGKTVQTIAALRVLHEHGLQPFPALIIAPNGMKLKWAKEFETWWPGGASVAVTGRTATARRKAIASGADVIVTNWESLKLHTRLAPYGSIRMTDKQKEPKELNGGWLRTVVADEVHRAKDPKSQQTRAWWQVSHEATYRYPLTATEIADSSADFWSIGHGYAPEDYPSRTAYISRYTDHSTNYWGGLEVAGLNPRTTDEFHAIRDVRYVRRTKADRVTPVYDVRPIELTPKQEKVYRQMAEHMIAQLDSGLLVESDRLVALGRLHQIAAGMPVLDDAGRVVALEEPSCKVDMLLDVIDEEPGEPLVVFGASRKLIELCDRVLGRKKIRYGVIHGNIALATRAQHEEQFQAGELQVILATIRAAAEGLTLNRAGRALFLQRDFSMIFNKQAQGRIDPIGEQAGSPHIIDGIAQGTVELALHDVVAGKVKTFEEITRDKDRLRAALLGAHAA